MTLYRKYAVSIIKQALKLAPKCSCKPCREIRKWKWYNYEVMEKED